MLVIAPGFFRPPRLTSIRLTSCCSLLSPLPLSCRLIGQARRTHSPLVAKGTVKTLSLARALASPTQCPCFAKKLAREVEKTLTTSPSFVHLHLSFSQPSLCRARSRLPLRARVRFDSRRRLRQRESTGHGYPSNGLAREPLLLDVFSRGDAPLFPPAAAAAAAAASAAAAATAVVVAGGLAAAAPSRAAPSGDGLWVPGVFADVRLLDAATVLLGVRTSGLVLVSGAAAPAPAAAGAAGLKANEKNRSPHHVGISDVYKTRSKEEKK